MVHEMKLQNAPFMGIASGKKRIEMRLYDEKRSKIQVGEDIVFTNTVTGQTLRRRVKALHVYADFETLYAGHGKEALGYAEDEEAKPTDMHAYYTDEDIKRYGVVGIELI